MMFRLLENAFASQKIESKHFTHATQAELSFRFLFLRLQAKENYPSPYAALFQKSVPPAEKWERKLENGF